MQDEGRVIFVSGPVVKANMMRGARMFDVVQVGEERLIGEIIELKDDVATIQVYEDTMGLIPGDRVVQTGAPLSVELGPGVISMIYDGIQRPLDIIKAQKGDFISRGVEVTSIDRTKRWQFRPTAAAGTLVKGGTVIGSVQETNVVEHRIMIPPDVEGTLEHIVGEGDYTVDETIASVRTSTGKVNIAMLQRWPVRISRPEGERFDPDVPLLTGQRIFDTFFPMAKGGTAAIPGGFGTGKTVSQHQLAKWSDADIVVYVGCGERGNEMTDVLTEFPELNDPRSGDKLMNRTVLIANTSNMPVAAREASVYTGITIAEYFRDMGYDVALMADSTSRWAEALREISGRLEEMPGEEGYPAYLASRLAGFYERAGRVRTLNGDIGSISVIGAVSPPGGDFSEPVTQNTLRIVKVFWALDADLADRRHFPSINWLRSYSLYLKKVSPWWSREVGDQWFAMREEAMGLLQQEAELQDIIQLVGPDALPAKDQGVLEGARLIRESFLRQNAFDDVDTFCSEMKQHEMMRIMLRYHKLLQDAIAKGIAVERLKAVKIKEDLSRMALVKEELFKQEFARIEAEMESEIGGMEVEE